MEDDRDQPLGTGNREIKPKECLDEIAARSGHKRETIWDHPDNAELKDKRKDWNVLLAGDRLQVPEIQLKQESLAIDQEHKLRVFGLTTKLRVRLLEDGEPLAGKDFTLFHDGPDIEGTTDGDGVVEVTVPIGMKRAVLYLEGRLHELSVGELDPATTSRGIQQRLANLGFNPGEVDGDVGSRTTWALRAFQDEHGLDVTGEPDDATAAKLIEVHGS